MTEKGVINREKLQSFVSNKLKNINRGIARISVRAGKTKIGLDSLNDNETNILIVYPNIINAQSWKSDIEKFGYQNKTFTFTTTNSLHKLEGNTYDVILCDEIHEKYTTKVFNSLSKIKSKRLLAFTGTLYDKILNKLEKHNLYVVVNYTLDSAIKDDIVKDYRIYVHMLKLNDTTEYDKLTNVIDYYKDLKESSMSNNRTRTYAETMERKKTLERMEFLFNHPIIINQVKKLLEKLKDEKVLIFCSRTEVADELSVRSYHSKLSKKVNNENLEMFVSAKKGHLSSVNAIQTGITIYDLNYVIYAGYDSNPTRFEQKFARSLLNDSDGKCSSIHVFCLTDTQMENWLNSALQICDLEKINHIVDNNIISRREYLKKKFNKEELYLYNGSICFPTEEKINDKVIYSFTDGSKYTLNPKKLIKLWY